MTYDGQHLRSYLDGKEVNSVAQTGDLLDWMDNFPRIGDGQPNDFRFDGAISNVRIYKRALTSQEVSYLYEQKF